MHLSGVRFCKKQQLLFVAGTLSGKGFLFHVQSSAGPTGPLYTVTKREVLELNLPGKSYINDVAVSQDKVYFTDSFNPILYQIPRFQDSTSSSSSSSGSSGGSFSLGVIGGAPAASCRPITRVKTGTHFETKAGQFRANGIAVYKTNQHKDVLLVSNTHTGHLYKVVVEKQPSSSSSSSSSGSSTQPKPATVAIAAAAAAAAGDGDLPVSLGDIAHQLQLQQAAPADKTKAAGAKAKAAVSSKPSPGAQTAAAPAAAETESRWSKLAKDVEEELQRSKKRKAAQQQNGQQVAVASTAAAPALTAQSIQDAATVAVQAGQTVALLSKLARDVQAKMRRNKEQHKEQQPDTPSPRAAKATAVSTAAAAARPRSAGFTATPSADAIIRSGMGSSSKNLLSSSSSWQVQDPVLLAEPVKIQEPVVDVSTAAFSAAAAAAAVATARAQQYRALGSRSLLGTGSMQLGWPGQMARGIAERLGLPVRQKQVTAEVTELQLPSIPGQYTQRILVDGIIIKNDMAYVADNYNNRVWGVQLGKGLSEAKVTCLLQGPAMHVPTTLLFQAGHLWWVNAHLDTCFPFLPCPAHKFELHGVSAGQCQPWSS